jgi:hypothetical protein
VTLGIDVLRLRVGVLRLRIEVPWLLEAILRLGIPIA